jgi:WD40 repeat protein/energy-coupling factor transporter ATP-binding protein EcfA2
MQEIDRAANPFPGLRPFESSETHLFFGRDGQSEELLRRLKRTRFLAVVGTSGSGKSSLVRAGLLPALQGGLMASAGSDWRIAILRPGGDPIGNLARALSSPEVLGSRDEKNNDMPAVMAETTLRRSSLGLVELVSRARTKLDKNGQPLFPDYENLLVVVDQFEELFRFKKLIEEENSKEDAAAFVKLLLEAVGQDEEKKIYVVLTMRSDFLGDCSQFFELPEAINNGQYLIPRMTRDERRAAISGPVAVGQGAISEPLVNQLLNDVGDNPDQLPILQHALMRTWDYWLGHRNGEPIDIPDYNAIGGMAQALSRHADEAYAELDEKQKAIAEKLFKGLTEKGTDNREIRRPMEVQEICELTGANEAAVIAVIEVFRREGRSFLMPPPTDALTGAPVQLNRESLIDISHESLIRNWERLKIWVDEESRSARIYRRLAETAVLHNEGGAGLWRDPDLGVALTWREQSNPNDVWAKRYHPEFPLAMNFLDTSVAARDAQLVAEEARRRKEIRRARVTALVFVLASLISLALAGYAVAQSRIATRAQKNASDLKIKAAELTELARQKQTEADTANVQALKLLNGAKIANERARALEKIADESKTEAEKQATIVIAKTAEARKQQSLAEDRQKLATSRELASTSTSQLFSDTQASLASAVKAEETANTTEADNALRQVLLEPRVQAVIKEYKGETSSGVFSPDGKFIVTDTSEATTESHVVRVSEVSSGHVLAQITRDIPTAATFSSDGKTILLSSQKGLWLWRWGVQSSPVKVPLELKEDGAANGAYGAIFSSDGKAVVIPRGNVVQVWQAGEDREPKLLLSLRGSVIKPGTRAEHNVDPLFSPDGRFIVAASESQKENAVNQISHVWEVSTGRRLPELQDGGLIVSAQFSANGKFMLGISEDESRQRTVRLWDLSTGRHSAVVDSDLRDNPLALSPDGQRFVTTGSDASIALLLKVPEADEAEGTKNWLWNLSGHLAAVTCAAFSPDGRFILTGSEDMTARLWDTQTGKLVSVLRGHEGAVQSVAFSPDGGLMFTTGADNKARLWRPSMGQGLNERVDPPKGTEALSITRNAAGTRDSHSGEKIYSPDGKYSLNINDDYMVEVSEVATGRRLASRPVHKASGNSVAFSGDGTFILTKSSDFSVEVWEWRSNRPPVQLIHNGPLVQVVISPDHRHVATVSSSDNGAAQIWDLPEPGGPEILKESREMFSRDGVYSTRDMAFSPDGRLLVTASSREDPTLPVDTAARIWGLDKYMPALTLLQSHSAPVVSVAFSPDGRFIVTGSEDGTARLWDSRTHMVVTTLFGNKSYVRRVAFSDDGKSIIVVSDETRLYPCLVCGPREELLKRAKERFTWELK